MIPIISTTIKREFLDPILAGSKHFERKRSSKFWDRRLNKFVGCKRGAVAISFLCGRAGYKFIVLGVRRYKGALPVDIAGTVTNDYYEIELGDRIT